MPESVGRILKKARESKHLSLEEVSERSRISKHIVLTIEEDRLDEIKSGFYAKSFVKTYAAFLGVSNEPSVKEYLGRTGYESQKSSEVVLKPRSKPVSKTSSEKINFPGIAKYKNQIIAIIMGIFVLWILSLAIGQAAKIIKNISTKKQNKVVKSAPLHHKDIVQTARQRTTSASITEKKEELKVNEPIKDVKKEVSDEKSDSVELEVFVSDNTWLQVTGDGEIMFTGLFKKGSKDTWKARKEIKLEAGDSGVVKINVNGKPASFSGKKGKKKEIIITKDGIKN
ncbi:MAG: DUF4115 domain-containing protein [Candidatus Omnitrophica bacterium]|nr:DUF4115 domain-containing protein [Candidatus Omnitrophota bacterium]